MICPKCGQEMEGDKCVECTRVEGSRVTHLRQHQGDWLVEAVEQGIQPWVQQPGETQWEYSVWVAYRDSYPGKKPSYHDVAEQMNVTTNAISKIAQRWTFPARMQAWMQECDRLTMLQRKEEILDMNKAHIDMAYNLRRKLGVAIDAIDPLILKPSEIASLAKLSSEMERKARIDTEAQEEIKRTLIVDNQSPDIKKEQTKQSDLAEVVQILLKSGAMSALGVKETTRELVVRTDE